VQRANEQQSEKARIGAAAASLVRGGETIFLGGGTTVWEVARRLEDREDLTVLTNSLLVLNALSSHKKTNLIVLGGIFRKGEHTFYGYLTVAALTEINPDKVFIGIRAVSLENGLTNDYLPEVSTDRAILESGREVILVADYTKFERVAPAFVGSLSLIDKVVTDGKTSSEAHKSLQEVGIEVLIA
jgi:DeoR/GlpR family transcriptional regulator of sugar metabolism